MPSILSIYWNKSRVGIRKLIVDRKRFRLSSPNVARSRPFVYKHDRVMMRAAEFDPETCPEESEILRNYFSSLFLKFQQLLLSFLIIFFWHFILVVRKKFLGVLLDALRWKLHDYFSLFVETEQTSNYVENIHRFIATLILLFTKVRLVGKNVLYWMKK